ncbi:GNAT family N-acetyltransferase [Lactiplantibacillus herbarum]|uniref:GNAT family N-acetyltransferase n=1 Tax=Lactiplantibacillus herbarum TaxID=1670446 RepID=UPI00064E6630|nr:GNAT family N-acetyltransferase [Lactiplantibacillus herbarum]
MIRKVLLKDAPNIQRINKLSLGYDYPITAATQQLQQLLSEPQHHLLLAAVDDDDQLIGYVHAEVYLETYAPKLFNVLALAVDQDSRGQGLGKALMIALVGKASEFQVHGIRLNSGSERTAAHQFYEHLGYTTTKMQKRFFLELP